MAKACDLRRLTARRPNCVRRGIGFIRRRNAFDTARDERRYIGQAHDVALVVVLDVLDDAAPRSGTAAGRRLAPQLDEKELFRPRIHDAERISEASESRPNPRPPAPPALRSRARWRRPWTDLRHAGT